MRPLRPAGAQTRSVCPQKAVKSRCFPASVPLGTPGRSIRLLVRRCLSGLILSTGTTVSSLGLLCASLGAARGQLPDRPGRPSLTRSRRLAGPAAPVWRWPWGGRRSELERTEHRCERVRLRREAAVLMSVGGGFGHGDSHGELKVPTVVIAHQVQVGLALPEKMSLRFQAWAHNVSAFA